jgi:hypothetical protein
LRLLWKPDFSQQIVINQGLKAVASYCTPRRLRRGMQKVCGIPSENDRQYWGYEQFCSEATIWLCFGSAGEMPALQPGGRNFYNGLHAKVSFETSSPDAGLKPEMGAYAIPKDFSIWNLEFEIWNPPQARLLNYALVGMQPR